MSNGFRDEEWQSILKIAREALELPKADRASFVEQRVTDPAIAREALNLAEELEEPEEDTRGPLGTSIGHFSIVRLPWRRRGGGSLCRPRPGPGKNRRH